MLFLLFQIGDDQYALPAGRVAEVIPLVLLKGLPQALPGMAGLLNYRGAPVPVADLSALLLGPPTVPRLSSRIILVRYPSENGSHLLGLMAERVVRTLRREEHEFTPAGVAVDSAPCLGPVTQEGENLIQRIEIESLLPREVQSVLFREAPTLC